MCILIAYHTQMIYKFIHIENIFRILGLKQAKFTWKSDILLLFLFFILFNKIY